MPLFLPTGLGVAFTSIIKWLAHSKKGRLGSSIMSRHNQDMELIQKHTQTQSFIVNDYRVMIHCSEDQLTYLCVILSGTLNIVVCHMRMAD